MLTTLDRYLSKTLDGFEDCRDRLIRWRSFWTRYTLATTSLIKANTYSSSLESYFNGLEIRAWGAATPSWSSSSLPYDLRVPPYLHSSRCGLIRLSILSLVLANKCLPPLCRCSISLELRETHRISSALFSSRGVSKHRPRFFWTIPEETMWGSLTTSLRSTWG
jgi:hypothetical protein